MAATAITALWDDGAIVAQPLPGVTGALPPRHAAPAPSGRTPDGPLGWMEF
jgi:hypothetical protein